MKPTFSCPCCGKGDCDVRVKNIVGLILQEVPDAKHSSGFRCEKHNKEVGGSPTSSHPDGLASDFEVRHSRTRFLILRKLLDLGVHRIGIYKKSIHFDIDPRKDPMVIWLG